MFPSHDVRRRLRHLPVTPAAGARRIRRGFDIGVSFAPTRTTSCASGASGRRSSAFARRGSTRWRDGAQHRSRLAVGDSPVDRCRDSGSDGHEAGGGTRRARAHDPTRPRRTRTRRYARALFAHTVEAAKDACARKLTSITRRATPCSDAPTRHPVPGSTSQGVRRPRESRGRP